LILLFVIDHFGIQILAPLYAFFVLLWLFKSARHNVFHMPMLV